MISYSSKTSLNSSNIPLNNPTCSMSDTVGTSYANTNKKITNNAPILCKNISIQENNGILKSGMVTVSFQTSKCKKAYYAVLSERSLELHESEKSQRKKKNAKYIIDISRCFNVSQQTYPKLKLVCVVMTPDETIFLKGETENETIEWFTSTLSACIPARALFLGRPVFSNEFFECCWDVTINPNPKLKKPVSNLEYFQNICVKIPSLSVGRHRLCFYPHTLIVSNVGIVPCGNGINLPKTGIPPFSSSEFVEFPLQYVAQFGSQEKFFIMRVGRFAPTGSCEVWIQCETDEIAADVHAKLNEMLDREKHKKQMGLMAMGHLPPLKEAPYSQAETSSVASAPTTTLFKSASISGNSISNMIKLGRESTSTLATIAEKPNAKLASTKAFPASASNFSMCDNFSSSFSAITQQQREAAKQKRLVLRDYKAKVDSLEEEELRKKHFEQRQKQLQIEGGLDQMIAADIRRVLKQSFMESKNPNSNSFGSIPNPEFFSGFNKHKEPQFSRIMSFNDARLDNHRNSIASTEEETEDSGGTLRIPYDSRTTSRSNVSQLAPNDRVTPPSGLFMKTMAECHYNTAGCSVSNENIFQNKMNSSKTNKPSSFMRRKHSEGDMIDQKKEKLQLFKKSFSLNSFFMTRIKKSNQLQKQNHIIQDSSDSSIIASTSLSELNNFTLKNALANKLQSVPSTTNQNVDLHKKSATEMNVDSTTFSSLNHRKYVDDENLSSTCSSLSACVPEERELKIPGNLQLMDGKFMSYEPNIDGQDAYIVVGNVNEEDKTSCSSGSASYLSVPHCYWENQQLTPSEEFCSYASDSGDSCYSSMVNGHLNSRALSFSSEMSRPYIRGAAKGTTGLVYSRHFPTPLNLCHSTIVDSNPSLDSSEKSPTQTHHSFVPGEINANASLTPTLPRLFRAFERPISEDEICVLNEDLAKPLSKLINLKECASPIDLYLKPDEASTDLRRRTFSLGNASWLTKPFRKLSFNSIHRHRNSASKSVPGSSSLVTSINHDYDESLKKLYGNGDCMGPRQPSTCSFASSKHNSDSIDLDKASLNSSQSITTNSNTINSCSSNASNLLSSKLISSAIRKKIAEKIPLGGDLVELDFAPNSTILTTRSCTSNCISESASDTNSPISALRGRTSSVGGKKMPHHEGSRPSFWDIPEFTTTPSKSFTLNRYYTSEDQERHLKPSEALIRKHISNSNGCTPIYNSKKHLQDVKSAGDCSLKEVQCFFSATDRELMQALSTNPSTSRSMQHNTLQKSFTIDGGAVGVLNDHFETIEEANSDKSSQASSINSLVRNCGASKTCIQTCVPEEEDEYVFLVPSKQLGNDDAIAVVVDSNTTPTTPSSTTKTTSKNPNDNSILLV